MVRESGVPALRLDGHGASRILLKEVQDRINAAEKEHGRRPGLGIVMANG